MFKKVTQYSKKNRFVYSLCCIEYRCLQTFNGLDMWGKCVTWIAIELSWRHMTHTFLTHICMFGLARVQVRLVVQSFNTNNRTLFMFGYSVTFEILRLWKLFCYFELVSWCIHKSHKVVATVRIHTNEICKFTYHIFYVLAGCNNRYWAQCILIIGWALNTVVICGENLLPCHISLNYSTLFSYDYPCYWASIWKQGNTT